MESYYIINQKMMYMEGQYDQYGKLCTKIIQTDKEFLVDMSPLKILKKAFDVLGLV